MKLVLDTGEVKETEHSDFSSVDGEELFSELFEDGEYWKEKRKDAKYWKEDDDLGFWEGREFRRE